MSHSVMQKKKKFAVFAVKVTAKANVINIWLWLLFLLNCWFFGNQTWSDDRLLEARASCGKNWITAFKVKVKAKGQNVDAYPDDIF